jgi:BTB/POZ domain/Ankyrin repeats (3 copies)
MYCESKDGSVGAMMCAEFEEETQTECDSFEAHAWQPQKCRNCFQHRSAHHISEAQQSLHCVQTQRPSIVVATVESTGRDTLPAVHADYPQPEPELTVTVCLEPAAASVAEPVTVPEPDTMEHPDAADADVHADTDTDTDEHKRMEHTNYNTIIPEAPDVIHSVTAVSAVPIAPPTAINFVRQTQTQTQTQTQIMAGTESDAASVANHAQLLNARRRTLARIANGVALRRVPEAARRRHRAADGPRISASARLLWSLRRHVQKRNQESYDEVVRRLAECQHEFQTLRHAAASKHFDISMMRTLLERIRQFECDLGPGVEFDHPALRNAGWPVTRIRHIRELVEYADRLDSWIASVEKMLTAAGVSVPQTMYTRVGSTMTADRTPWQDAAESACIGLYAYENDVCDQKLDHTCSISPVLVSPDALKSAFQNLFRVISMAQLDRVKQATLAFPEVHLIERHNSMVDWLQSALTSTLQTSHDTDLPKRLEMPMRVCMLIQCMMNLLYSKALSEFLVLRSTKLLKTNNSAKAARAYKMLQNYVLFHNRLLEAGLIAGDTDSVAGVTHRPNSVERIQRISSYLESDFHKSIQVRLRQGQWDRKQTVELKSVSETAEWASSNPRTTSKLSAAQQKQPKLLLELSESIAAHDWKRMRELLQVSHSDVSDAKRDDGADCTSDSTMIRDILLSYHKFLLHKILVNDEKHASVEPAKLLLAACQVHVTALSESEHSDAIRAPLHYEWLHDAVSKHRYDVMDMLIDDAAVDINHHAMNGGHTPLHVAARRSDLDTVAYLLSKGADPLAFNALGQTPLQILSTKCFPPVHFGKDTSDVVQPSVPSSSLDSHCNEDQQTLSLDEESATQQSLAVRMAGMYARYLMDEQLSDCTIVTDDGEHIPAHRIVLSANSPMFASIFEHDWKENLDGQVQLSQVSTKALKCMLEFMYTGQCHFIVDDHGLVTQLLELSNRFLLDRMRGELENITIPRVNEGNALDLYIAAVNSNARLLQQQCTHVLLKNYGTIVKSSSLIQDDSMNSHRHHHAAVAESVSGPGPEREEPGTGDESMSLNQSETLSSKSSETQFNIDAVLKLHHRLTVSRANSVNSEMYTNSTAAAAAIGDDDDDDTVEVGTNLKTKFNSASNPHVIDCQLEDMAQVTRDALISLLHIAC